MEATSCYKLAVEKVGGGGGLLQVRILLKSASGNSAKYVLWYGYIYFCFEWCWLCLLSTITFQYIEVSNEH